MPLCGSSTCGCALASIPATTGEINGSLPSIDVAGNGTSATPWNLTLNSEWAANFSEGTFVPTLTQSATPAKTVTRAAYWRTGGGVSGHVRLAVTSSGTSTNAVVVGLPVATAANYSANDVLGSGWIFDSSAGFYYFGDLVWTSTTTARFLVRTNGAAATFLGSTSFTAALAVNDVVQYQFSYEPA